MTTAADLLVTNAEVHTLTDPNETYEAIAIRDGRIVRLGSTYDIEFLAGTETTTIDLGGRTVLPGFIDAHTHLLMTGRALVHADLSGAASLEEALSRLADRADELTDGDTAAGSSEATDELILGFGYDESGWPHRRYPTREDLDSVSETRPIVAFREDMHVASVNSAALDRFGGRLPAKDVKTENGRPTGVLVETAIDPIYEAVEPDPAGTERLVRAAQAAANERGVTMIHDMVRNSHAPRVYRDLDLAGELSIRVRLNYWTDHLESVLDAGLRTNAGSEMLQTGAIKSFSDGSIGGQTAKLSEPFSDGEDNGQWVVDPEELRSLVERADEAGLQFTTHAIGDVAIDTVLDIFEECADPSASRHRIEHLELATDEAIERFAESGIVASMQPNFHKWAAEGGLYADRLGDRRTETNRLRSLLDAGAHVAFGSDCMPLDPLFGVHHAVNAPEGLESISVTEALRAYTTGAAYAGFDENRLGTIEPGKLADLTVLDDSPWETSEAIADIDVVATIVGGEVVYKDL
ncbi:amidohydrolase [Halalkalirubrum salinum]|uniref:amidohydrolase n=1 Tax=Halalkalirubrum salinum TaxID=2563889 RepID=UPI0010FB9FAB|nr:amidohydrolase [Halalkalirubrum salinum]